MILLGGFGVLLLWPQPYEWLMARSSGLLSFADGAVSRAGSGDAGGLVVGLALGAGHRAPGRCSAPFSR